MNNMSKIGPGEAGAYFWCMSYPFPVVLGPFRLFVVPIFNSRPGPGLADGLCIITMNGSKAVRPDGPDSLWPLARIYY